MALPITSSASLTDVRMMAIKSGFIQFVGFSYRHQTLVVQMRNGSIYNYKGDLASIFCEMIESHSPGKVFARVSNGSFETTRVA